jgi:hypothetical protein
MLYSKTINDKLADAWGDYSKLIREQSESINNNQPMTLEESKYFMRRKEEVLYRIALYSDALDQMKMGEGVPTKNLFGI